jgi:hypothetical protein
LRGILCKTRIAKYAERYPVGFRPNGRDKTLERITTGPGAFDKSDFQS